MTFTEDVSLDRGRRRTPTRGACVARRGSSKPHVTDLRPDRQPRRPVHQRTTMPAPSPWWSPERHADRRPMLLARNRIVAALRRWFHARGFVEVETASLQASPGNEAHLHAFVTEAVAPDGTRAPLYLHTSPEFACKKLLAAGERPIVDFARVFRNRERGPLHHPEFTLLEWYRTEEPYEALMRDCADILALAAETASARTLAWHGRSADPFAD